MTDFKSLTKQQIFDLEFKWKLILPNCKFDYIGENYFLKDIFNETEYYYTDKFWTGISVVLFDENLHHKQYVDYKTFTNFIKDYKDYVDWFRISQRKRLSTKFIREYKDYVDWFIIPGTRTLSEELLWEFRDYIKWKCVNFSHRRSGKACWGSYIWCHRNMDISEEFKEKLIREGYIK